MQLPCLSNSPGRDAPRCPNTPQGCIFRSLRVGAALGSRAGLEERSEGAEHCWPRHEARRERGWSANEGAKDSTARRGRGCGEHMESTWLTATRGSSASHVDHRVGGAQSRPASPVRSPDCGALAAAGNTSTMTCPSRPKRCWHDAAAASKACPTTSQRNAATHKAVRRPPLELVGAWHAINHCSSTLSLTWLGSPGPITTRGAALRLER